MRKLFLLGQVLICFYSFSQEKKTEPKQMIVEASCGQCNFGMKSQKGCDLAVKIDGKAYFVDGTTIDDHGDAHAKDGFCLAIKKAEVKGEIIGDRFKVVYFQIIEPPKK